MTGEVDDQGLLVGDGHVATLLTRPPDARAVYVFAHGAGAGMHHPFMDGFAVGLADRGVASLRYQFPFMQRGSGRTDRPEIAHATVRAACRKAVEILAGLPVFAGGKSFGGRMTSQAQALGLLPGVAGLVFVGFPLHAAGKPSVARAAHLADVRCPMLFLAGTRDDLADLGLLTGVATSLGERARLATFHDADHAFHVRKKSGGDDARTLASMLDVTTTWMATVARFDSRERLGAGRTADQARLRGDSGRDPA